MKIVLSLPPTFNKTYKTASYDDYAIVGGMVVQKSKARFYKDSRAGDWQNDSFFEIKRERFNTMTGPVEVRIVWYLKYDRDIDSGEKIIFDTLQLAQVIENDRQIVKSSKEKLFCKSRPRVEIEITEVLL